MTYFSVIYLLIFLPVIALIYNFLPQKHRWKLLLLASFAFFFSISKGLIVYAIGSTFLIHYIGIWLDNVQEERNILL